MAKQDDFVRYTIRLPRELYDRVQSYADLNERSVNGEVNVLLDYALWHTDMDRIEAGMEPPREITPSEREMIEINRENRAGLPGILSQATIENPGNELSFLDEIDSLKEKLGEVVDGLQRLSSVRDPRDPDDKT